MTTILVAEDEPDISNLIAFTLKFGGFEVISTSNGVDAVARAQQENPDLIILDVRMPRMTGYEACRVLKADPSTAEIPVVFLSARGQENEVKAGIESGGVDYILKPFAPDKLIERVKGLLNSHAPAATGMPVTGKAASPAGERPAGERSEAGADEKARKSGEEPATPPSAGPPTGLGAGSPASGKAASPAGEPPAGERSEAGADEKARKSGEEPATPPPAAPPTGPVAGSPATGKPGEEASGGEQLKQAEVKAGKKPNETQPEGAKDGEAKS